MTDLKRLIAWHEAEGCRFAEFMATDDHDRRRVEVHRETARILSVLLRVREGCDIQEIESWEGSQQLLMIVGQFKSLRDLAELLGGSNG